MAYLILHHDGAYNLYNQVSDGPVYRQALTLQQLKVAIRLLHGEAGPYDLPNRLERAHKFGSSGLHDTTLAQAIAANRAGRSERTLSLSEFIKEYLTLQEAVTTMSAEMETRADNTLDDSAAGALFENTRHNPFVASFPLPADHWLYAPQAPWDAARDESSECPLPVLAVSLRDAVIAAARYAIRGATACGTEPDFDPDALVINLCYALFGPANSTAESSASK